MNEYNITQGHHQSSVLDSLVRTILSQNTTDKTSIRAFASLKETFPDWEAVRTADVGDVAESIRVGGLADAKAGWLVVAPCARSSHAPTLSLALRARSFARIQTILQTLHEERGACTLEWLREKQTDEIKEYLLAFKGVGPKTVSCTLLFALERADFPVDTHVCRIAGDLGWVGKGSSREATYEHLNGVLEDELKYDLHITLVEHGKTCGYCSTRRGSVSPDECPVKLAKAERRKEGGARKRVKAEDVIKVEDVEDVEDVVKKEEEEPVW